MKIITLQALQRMIVTTYESVAPTQLNIMKMLSAKYIPQNALASQIS